MFELFITKSNIIFRRLLSAGMAAVFLLSSVLIPTPGWAKEERAAVFSLPQPGRILKISETFAPAILRGLTIHPDNPLQFDFIIDTGDKDLKGASFEAESQRLIKYFLAALTVPEDELWVNLSPYENNRIIPEGLGVTEMGKDMLSQDYLLKQLTASLMYPEEDLGQAFWNKVYKKAYELYGTTNIPVNTFNKVWIVPDKAVVYEHEGSAFVVERHLKVMLEEDYLALEHNLQSKDLGLHKQSEGQAKELNELSSKIVKDIILPAIEKEVNEGQTFANLRQIYNSMILATWYKKNLRDSLLGQVYMDRNKVKGIDVEDKEIKEKIYQQYLDAFKQGVYNYIREDYDEATQQVIPRKYFSGGLGVGVVTVDKLEVLRGQPGRLPGRVSSAITQPESTKGKDRRVSIELVENADKGLDDLSPTEGSSSPILKRLYISWNLFKLGSSNIQRVNTALSNLKLTAKDDPIVINLFQVEEDLRGRVQQVLEGKSTKLKADDEVLRHLHEAWKIRKGGNDFKVEYIPEKEEIQYIPGERISYGSAAISNGETVDRSSIPPGYVIVGEGEDHTDGYVTGSLMLQKMDEEKVVIPERISVISISTPIPPDNASSAISAEGKVKNLYTQLAQALEKQQGVNVVQDPQGQYGLIEFNNKYLSIHWQTSQLGMKELMFTVGVRDTNKKLVAATEINLSDRKIIFSFTDLTTDYAAEGIKDYFYTQGPDGFKRYPVQAIAVDKYQNFYLIVTRELLDDYHQSQQNKPALEMLPVNILPEQDLKIPELNIIAKVAEPSSLGRQSQVRLTREETRRLEQARRDFYQALGARVKEKLEESGISETYRIATSTSDMNTYLKTVQDLIGKFVESSQFWIEFAEVRELIDRKTSFSTFGEPVSLDEFDMRKIRYIVNLIGYELFFSLFDQVAKEHGIILNLRLMNEQLLPEWAGRRGDIFVPRSLNRQMKRIKEAVERDNPFYRDLKGNVYPVEKMTAADIQRVSSGITSINLSGFIPGTIAGALKNGFTSIAKGQQVDLSFVSPLLEEGQKYVSSPVTGAEFINAYSIGAAIAAGGLGTVWGLWRHTTKRGAFYGLDGSYSWTRYKAKRKLLEQYDLSDEEKAEVYRRILLRVTKKGLDLTDNYSEIMDAIKGMGIYQSKQAILPLISLLYDFRFRLDRDHRGAAVKESILESLTSLAGDFTLYHIRSLLDHPDRDIHVFALNLIAHLNMRAAIPLLQPLLIKAKNDAGMRVLLNYILARLGQQGHVPALLEWLQGVHEASAGRIPEQVFKGMDVLKEYDQENYKSLLTAWLGDDVDQAMRIFAVGRMFELQAENRQPLFDKFGKDRAIGEGEQSAEIVVIREAADEMLQSLGCSTREDYGRIIRTLNRMPGAFKDIEEVQPAPEGERLRRVKSLDKKDLYRLLSEPAVVAQITDTVIRKRRLGSLESLLRSTNAVDRDAAIQITAGLNRKTAVPLLESRLNEAVTPENRVLFMLALERFGVQGDLQTYIQWARNLRSPTPGQMRVLEAELLDIIRMRDEESFAGILVEWVDQPYPGAGYNLKRHAVRRLAEYLRETADDRYMRLGEDILAREKDGEDLYIIRADVLSFLQSLGLNTRAGLADYLRILKQHEEGAFGLSRLDEYLEDLNIKAIKVINLERALTLFSRPGFSRDLLNAGVDKGRFVTALITALQGSKDHAESIARGLAELADVKALDALYDVMFEATSLGVIDAFIHISNIYGLTDARTLAVNRTYASLNAILPKNKVAAFFIEGLEIVLSGDNFMVNYRPEKTEHKHHEAVTETIHHEGYLDEYEDYDDVSYVSGYTMPRKTRWVEAWDQVKVIEPARDELVSVIPERIELVQTGTSDSPVSSPVVTADSELQSSPITLAGVLNGGLLSVANGQTVDLSFTRPLTEAGLINEYTIGGAIALTAAWKIYKFWRLHTMRGNVHLLRIDSNDYYNKLSKERMIGYGAKIIPHLIRVLKNPKTTHAYKAEEILVVLREDIRDDQIKEIAKELPLVSAVKILTGMIINSDRKEPILSVLLNTAGIDDVLYKILANHQVPDSVRLSILDFIADSHKGNAAEPLLNLLSEENKVILNAVEGVLEKLGVTKEKLVKAYIMAAQKGKGIARLRAVRTLGDLLGDSADLDNKGAIEVLTGLLYEDDEPLIKAVESSLNKLGVALSDLIDTYISILEKGKGKSAKLNAVKVLENLRVKKAVPVLLKMFSEADIDLLEAVDQALKTLEVSEAELAGAYLRASQYSEGFYEAPLSSRIWTMQALGKVEDRETLRSLFEIKDFLRNKETFVALEEILRTGGVTEDEIVEFIDTHHRRYPDMRLEIISDILWGRGYRGASAVKLYKRAMEALLDRIAREPEELVFPILWDPNEGAGPENQTWGRDTEVIGEHRIPNATRQGYEEEYAEWTKRLNENVSSAIHQKDKAEVINITDSFDTASSPVAILPEYQASWDIFEQKWQEALRTPVQKDQRMMEEELKHLLHFNMPEAIMAKAQEALKARLPQSIIDKIAWDVPSLPYASVTYFTTDPRQKEQVTEETVAVLDQLIPGRVGAFKFMAQGIGMFQGKAIFIPMLMTDNARDEVKGLQDQFFDMTQKGPKFDPFVAHATFGWIVEDLTGDEPEILLKAIEDIRYEHWGDVDVDSVVLSERWFYQDRARDYRQEIKRYELGKEPEPASSPLGGIDFNPAALDLQIKRDGQGVPLPLPQQPVGDMRIDGFLPVIINIAPVNIPLLLGLTEEGPEESPPSATRRSALPSDSREKFYAGREKDISWLN